MVETSVVSCPLCDSSQPNAFYESLGRVFYACPQCTLRFVPASYHLTASEEKARYEEHENDPHDPRYQTYLSHLLDCLSPSPSSMGLDYGSGPTLGMKSLAQNRGIAMEAYDKFFFPDEKALEKKYDFITCNETAEHFSHPAREFHKLKRLLNPHGKLGVRTQMLTDWDQFPKWYYHRDPTHISFFAPSTLLWLANHLSWRVEFPKRDIAIFTNP